MFGRRKNGSAERGPDLVMFRVAWGGFYTQRNDSGGWNAFRLLDFNRDAYHSTMYRETFASPPLLADVLDLKPFMGHAPISTGQLVNFPATLIGEQHLTVEDLYGYDAYLEHAAGLPQPDRAEFLQKIVGFSLEPTLGFTLGFDSEGSLLIEQAV